MFPPFLMMSSIQETVSAHAWSYVFYMEITDSMSIEKYL